MSFLLSLFDGGLLTQLVALLGVLGAAIGGVAFTKRSSYNKGKADAASDNLKDMANAARTRNDVQAGVDASSDDDVRRRLREGWTKPDR